MDELQQRCLETFPQWLAGLPDDARALLLALEDEDLPEVHRRWVAAGLSYLVKSLDLIPDGVEELGFIDDAFVLRVACARAVNAVQIEADIADSVIARLASETELIEAYLGDLHSRLSAYVASLPGASVRGRSVEQVVFDKEVRHELAHEVETWAAVFEVPNFSRDEKSLVKLTAFMGAKLP